jgi:hypothetical protein
MVDRSLNVLIRQEGFNLDPKFDYLNLHRKFDLLQGNQLSYACRTKRKTKPQTFGCGIFIDARIDFVTRRHVCGPIRSTIQVNRPAKLER